MKKILITGTSGFIGYHLTEILISSNFEIYGIDSINDYYDIELKYSRLKNLGFDKKQIKSKNPIISDKYKNLIFQKTDLSDYKNISKIFDQNKFDYVINLAAQAGVRYSIKNPYPYLKSNMEGFLNILEGCRKVKVKHLIYASTSSVYGLNTNVPFEEDHVTDHPISFYSATKKSNEIMAHSYSHLYNIPSTGLRFFTVYGPWGRPDMALFLFTDAMIKNKPINVFNNGNMVRDFTYVLDIVNSIKKLINKPPKSNNSWDSKNPLSSTSSCPYQILNIGNADPINLMEYVSAIEENLNMKAKINFMPMQDGDVPFTFSNSRKLYDKISFKPSTSVKIGVKKFIDWYKIYYSIS